MKKDRYDIAGTSFLYKDFHGSHAFDKLKAREKVKKRIHSSPRRYFECLLRLSFLIVTLEKAASRVFQETLTLLFSREIVKLWRVGDRTFRGFTLR